MQGAPNQTPMDYFDFLGSISPQKEITAKADKEFTGPGNKNSNNRELVSPTKETKEREHRILAKIKTKKWCGNKEVMNIAKKYGKVEKLKMDKENTPNKRKMFYIKYKQREEMNRAQIELKEKEKIAEVTAIEEQRVNMTKTTDEQQMYKTSNSTQRTKIQKSTRCILLWYKEGRKNHMKVKDYLGRQFNKVED